ncbi:MAG: hypothetical protein U5K72_12620 [Balneolaceae bacterium]|nr:hypothetical protein [Balneolaceae bacterium]
MIKDIEVKILFQPENLGVKKAVYEALKWFFLDEDQGIILEDDCLPAPVFFDYCEELLELYKNDRRIGMITGRNEFGKYENQFEGDYFLSTRSYIWGWATWKDRIMDLDIDIHHNFGMGDMVTLFKNTSSFHEYIYRRKTISDLKEGKVDTWDYQWALSLLMNKRYTIVPKENMVKNIGLGEGATHKFQTRVDSVGHFKEKKDLEHPTVLKVDKNYTQETVKKENGKLWRLLIPRFMIKIARVF